jgi:hypothetical protein
MKTTPTNPSAAIRILAIVATMGLFGAASVPALADDGFINIHMDNQKIGSAVWAYWQSQLPLSTSSKEGLRRDPREQPKIGSAQGALAQVPDAIAVSP